MNHSMPGLPVHHHLPQSTQTHVHWVSHAIQSPHPLSSPSPPALNLSQPQGLSNESALRIRWPKHWSFSFNISPSNEHPVLISFRMDWLAIIREIQIKTTISYCFKLARMAIIKKTRNDKCWREWEEREHSYTAVGNVNWYKEEMVWSSPMKLKIEK